MHPLARLQTFEQEEQPGLVHAAAAYYRHRLACLEQPSLPRTAEEVESVGRDPADLRVLRQSQVRQQEWVVEHRDVIAERQQPARAAIVQRVEPLHPLDLSRFIRSR
jgi:hypothetical protein